MTGRGFQTNFSDLPLNLPIFPLAGVILLPRMELPLNIFEPRYLAMIDHALSSHRLIGVIQPQLDKALHKVGCAGRIVSVSETEDGRYLITLKGLCRFAVAEETALHIGGFRNVRPDWSGYVADYNDDKSTEICRDTLVARLETYLRKKNMSCSKWDDIRQVSCEQLISTLSMVCPFTAQEKQALLEAPDLKHRAEVLFTLMDIAAQDHNEGDACH